MNQQELPIFSILLRNPQSRQTTMKGMEAAKELAASLEAFEGETLPVVAIALAINPGIVFSGHGEATRGPGIGIALQIITELANLPDAAAMMRKPA